MSKSSAKDRSSTNSDAPQRAGEDTKEHRGPGVLPLPAGKPGHTTPSQAANGVPRLPHERDESADSQSEGAGDSPGAELARQAFEDVERGLVNTDRGLEGDTLVNDVPSRGKSKRDNTPI